MRSLRRRDAFLPVLFGAAVVLALMTVFAIELANNQSSSRANVRARVHDRAVLAGSLIDGLFGTVVQQSATYSKTYGAKVVSQATMNKNLQTNVYIALLDSSGKVIAATKGFTPAVHAGLATSAALAQLRQRHFYGLGDARTYPGLGAVLDFAVPFQTSYGIRTLISGFRAQVLSSFLSGDLLQIPGVKGARNYIIDGSGTVLASNTKASPAGSKFSGPVPTTTVLNFTADTGGRYYEEHRLANSGWRVVLGSPDGPLYASVSGLHKWLPWVIFVAFAFVAGIALVLVSRVLRASALARDANRQLAVVNGELANSNDMLEQRATELARSNAELDQFASIASHDLQEPLRKVRTFTEQLAVTEGENLSDKGRDYLGRANAAAERMQILIEDLLRFSRVATHARPFAPVDLNLIVGEVLEDLSDQVERMHAVVNVGDLPTVEADALQIRQLLQNLISNALKFHEPGATPEVNVTATGDAAEVKLVVADNGIGFDPRYSARIFRVFERLHGRGEYTGTGIGLALCRKIVERHGGGIAAVSEPGVGSTFTVTLPTGHPAATPAATAAGDGRAEREETHVPS